MAVEEAVFKANSKQQILCSCISGISIKGDEPILEVVIRLIFYLVKNASNICRTQHLSPVWAARSPF